MKTLIQIVITVIILLLAWSVFVDLKTPDTYDVSGPTVVDVPVTVIYQPVEIIITATPSGFKGTHEPGRNDARSGSSE